MCSVATFAVLFLSVHWELPRYAQRFSMREQVQPYAERCRDIRVPVVCYPRCWDSVSFYLGREDVDGTLAHKLKVVRKNGDVSYVYLDPDHFLEIRVLTQRMKHGALVEEEVDIGDYEKVNGVYVPFSVESGAKGDTDKQKIVFEKAEGNVTVDDSIFKFPASK